ncbi:hypothetical protein LMOf6854_2301 [Listeria monocytogenes str. 1/2a F6854]|nr:hypothetical protein LMOf6854_2301 [Listeria monocytogenes str. 1/2a F6854] [Listeria monocytogenes serotype 1/2a str. F6854]
MIGDFEWSTGVPIKPRSLVVPEILFSILFSSE